LHLDGYYAGITNVKAIELGFTDALAVINALKPYSNNGLK
jgi:hypothetical protein